MARIVMAVFVALLFAVGNVQAAPQANNAAAQTGTKAAATTKSTIKGSAPKWQAALPVTGESTLDRIDRTGTLRVGVAVNVPWVAHDKNGQLIGYSVDVARKLAADMGWKLELVPTSWPNLLTDLRANDYDVIISGLSITPQRARQVRFTTPTGEYGVRMVVNRNKTSAHDVSGFLKAGDRQVAVLAGTRTAGIAHAMLPGVRIIEVDDQASAIADLRAGKIDALVAEAPTPRLLGQIYPKDLRELGGPLGQTAHGFAVRIGDRDLRDVLDAWIIDAQASGWLKQRADYWFRGTDWAAQL